MAATVWSGTISFGLVSIPVKFQPSTKSHDLHFNLLHRKCKNRIRLQYYCPKDDETVERSELVKGFEYEKGKYVILEDEDLEAIEPQSSSNLEIEQFVDLAEIDSILYEKSYYVAPSSSSTEKNFVLFLMALQEKNRAAIGKLFMREHEYLAAIRPGMDGLIVHLMMYEDEIRKNENTIRSMQSKPRPKELELAGTLIDHLTEPFDPGKYKSSYMDRLHDLIEAKAKGRKLTIYSKKEKPKVVDLMEALRKSVEQAQPKKRVSGRAKKATA